MCSPAPSRDDLVTVAVCEGADCDSCGNHMTSGVAVLSPDGMIPIVALCIWCVGAGLQEATGFGVLNQLLNWETRRHMRRVTQWRGWRRVQAREPAPDPAARDPP